MTLEADGFEQNVLEALVELDCPACHNASVVKVIDVLRGATPDVMYAKEANADYVQSQVGKIMCSGCGLDVRVYFGHGEVQPARYRFVLYGVMCE